MNINESHATSRHIDAPVVVGDKVHHTSLALPLLKFMFSLEENCFTVFGFRYTMLISHNHTRISSLPHPTPLDDHRAPGCAFMLPALKGAAL